MGFYGTILIPYQILSTNLFFVQCWFTFPDLNKHLLKQKWWEWCFSMENGGNLFEFPGKLLESPTIHWLEIQSCAGNCPLHLLLANSYANNDFWKNMNSCSFRKSMTCLHSMSCPDRTLPSAVPKALEEWPDVTKILVKTWRSWRW